jgi:hypothetical protein
VRADRAEVIGLQALGFLAADERRLGALLAQAGWTLEDLRAGAGEPMVLAGVLDFLLGNEPILMEFCAEMGCAPEEPARARYALPGGGFEG